MKSEFMPIFEKAREEYDKIQYAFNSQVQRAINDDSMKGKILSEQLADIESQISDVVQVRSNVSYIQGLQTQYTNLQKSIGMYSETLDESNNSLNRVVLDLRQAENADDQERVRQCVVQKKKIKEEIKRVSEMLRTWEQQSDLIQRRIQQIIERSHDKSILSSLHQSKHEIEEQVNNHKLEHQKRNAELNSRLRAEILDQENVILTNSLAQLNQFIASIQEFEKELKEGEQEFNRVVNADFESKAQIFEDAAEFHRSQSRRIFWSIVAMLLFTGTVVFVAFFSGYESDNNGQVPSQLTGVSEYVVRLLGLGIGRVSILLFCAFGLRYLTSLHSAHSEQAIIYRDRKAALGVIQNLLSSGITLEQRQYFLETLTAGYLDFERNAFHSPDRQTSDSAVDVGDNIKTLKGFVDVVRPLLESLKKGDGAK